MRKLFTLALFGNHRKEFVIGQKLTYTKQRRKNVTCFVVKAVNYLRAKKQTVLKLSPR